MIRVYEKTTCTMCRRLATLLDERGVDFDRVDYHVEPLSEDEIRALVRKTGEPASALLRRKEPAFKELGLDSGDHSDDEVIALMAEHPALLQRPIVEMGDRAVLARPPERVLELL